MSPFQQIKDEIAFVAVGAFNPKIFHPEWFLRHRLLPEKEVSESEIELVHLDVSKFSTTWFFLEVLQNRFSLRTLNSSRSEDLRDLVVNVFTILCETPVSAVGFNRTIEFSCASEEIWHKVGHSLAPKSIWGQAFPDASPETEIGTKNLSVEVARKDGMPGNIRVTMSPTNYPPNQALSFGVNNHVEIANYLLINKEEKLASVILERWDDYMSQAEQAITKLLELIENG